jgi:DNA-binding NarL/FixJ family response regulator
LRLTKRERELVDEIIAGRTNKVIAQKYSVREQTVRNQLSVLFEKFGVRTRLELAVAVMRQKHSDQ